MAIDTSSSFVRGRLIGLLLTGIVLIIFAIHQLITIWTPISSLVALRGTLQSCNTYVTTISSKGWYGYAAKSQKAELIFYLHEHKKKFVLAENIGSDYIHKEFNQIKDKLDRANSVNVWIKRSELEYWEPQVFQIEADKEKALDFQSVRFKNRPLTAFLLFMGIGCILFPIYAFYPKLFDLS